MKITPRHLLLGPAAVFLFTLTYAALAQEPAAPAPTSAAPAQAEPEKSSPAVATPPAAVTAAPVEAAAPAAETPKSSELRRLDTPAAENSDAGKSPRETTRERVERMRERRANRTGHATVNILRDSHLAKGEQSDAVVAILGSSTSEGDVADLVLAVLGNVRVTGSVGDAAVAVLGNNYVNSHVHGNVVAVLGNLELGPEAEVDGDVVCVGGAVTRDPKAIVHRGVQLVGFGQFFDGMGGLTSWIQNCLLYGRPLSFSPGVGWAWVVATAFLAFYVFLALLFRGGVDKCVETLNSRPGYSVLASLLTILLLPVVVVLLIVTVIGIFIVPFLTAGLSLFGKAVMLAWLGGKLTRFFGNGPLRHPAFAVLVGGLIVMLLYTVPVLGFVVFKLFGWLGMGVVVYTLILGSKREKPAVAPAAGLAPGVAAGVAAVGAATGVVAGDPGAPAVAGVVAVPPLVSASTLPRAGFWIRVAALLLDVILVGILCSLLSDIFPRDSHVHIQSEFLPALAIYGALMWKLKGTTIGGIVCGLRVVRIDDRPIDWGTAIVRALGCFLSLVVVGLGFIWVAFDDDKQSWHDKIAGTTVVRVPRGVSLV